MPSRKCLVIGIGNPDRGDDAVGLIVAQLIKARRPADESVYLIDACRAGMPPGAIKRFDIAASGIPHRACGYSTHGMGLAEAFELARTLGRLPSRCVLYAIEGRTYDLGDPLSADVAAAAENCGADL